MLRDTCEGPLENLPTASISDRAAHAGDAVDHMSSVVEFVMLAQAAHHSTVPVVKERQGKGKRGSVLRIVGVRAWGDWVAGGSLSLFS